MKIVDLITSAISKLFSSDKADKSDYLSQSELSFSGEVPVTEWDLFFERSSKIVSLILVASFVVGIGLVVFRKGGSSGSSSMAESGSSEIVLSSTTSAVTPEIVVDIQGAVFYPNVYKLKDGSRISDLIILSGGPTASADKYWIEKNLNKAEKLRDGQKIYIPKIGENGSSDELRQKVTSSVATKLTESTRVNINSADQATLDRLPGISKTIAGNIIAYREKYGRFNDISEIQKVKGIKSGIFGKIKDLISTD